MILGEIANVRSGLVLSRKRATTGDNVAYKLLNLRCFNENGTIDKSAIEPYYAEDELKDAYLTHVGDVLIRLSVPYTAVAIDKSTAGLVISSHFTVIRVDQRKILPEFLAWLLNTDKTKHCIEMSSTGSALGTVKPSFIGTLSLKVPSLDKQKKISALNDLAIKKVHLLKLQAEESREYYQKLINELAQEREDN